MGIEDERVRRAFFFGRANQALLNPRFYRFAAPTNAREEDVFGADADAPLLSHSDKYHITMSGRVSAPPDSPCAPGRRADAESG